MEVNIHEAKTNLSRLLRRVAGGEEIITVNAGVPVARLVPAEPARAERRLGRYDGLIWMANDFDEALPKEVLAGFYAERSAPRKRRHS